MRRHFILFLFLALGTNSALAQTNFSVPYEFCPGQGPTQVISFALHQPGPIKLVVEHVFTNTHVRTILDSYHSAGAFQIGWNGLDENGQPVETGVYIYKLSGEGWEVEQWGVIDCGADAAIQSRIIVGGRDVLMGFTNIIEDIGATELGIYTADGATRVQDFSYMNSSHVAFNFWAFEDTAGQILPAGNYIYRMVSATYSEDIPFTIDPINRGSLSVIVTDADGAMVTGIDGAGDAPLVKGPVQQIEVDFGRSMSAAEIEYILQGGIKYYGALEWAWPSSPTVRPDSTGIIFNEFELSRSWPDIWGEGSVMGYGLFDPRSSRFKFGFDHEGYTRSDHFCHTFEIDPEDWITNPGPFYFTASGTMMPACENPIPPGQHAEIQYQTDVDGHVMIHIIDSFGNTVRQLVNGYMSAGYHTVYWDRLDNVGAEVPEGLYHLIWEASSEDGGQVITSGDIYVSNIPTAVPHGVVAVRVPTLSANHPNPFNPATVISFELPKATFARITVFALDGKKVSTLVAALMDGGKHSVTWNGQDQRGGTLPSGAYFYRLEADGVVDTRRMLLLK